ncbi:hypothetical protein [Candidatus Parabeggiatoa sp. HSG14]|uniref:hypothetical protein n=1 Tax=Candidatus Parabeggiatoa sp. HSG14 TaxID=3055593 RepID=UPI0025A834CF|nr:hypothetical protein [Thiotrichales bacterium HSG14]
MLQAIEAVIEKDGTISLLESLHPVRPMRAVVTLLEPIAKPVVPTGHVSGVLALLNSPAFQNAPAGTPAAMEAIIQANRTDWED